MQKGWNNESLVQKYIARPADQKSLDTVVIILSDIFGVAFINNFLLADDFAARGYLAIIPDLFNGDPIRLVISRISRFNFLLGFIITNQFTLISLWNQLFSMREMI